MLHGSIFSCVQLVGGYFSLQECFSYLYKHFLEGKRRSRLLFFLGNDKINVNMWAQKSHYEDI